MNKILSENQRLRKDIEALKEFIGFTDKKVASVQKDHKVTEQANSTSKKVTEINQNLSDLEERLSTREYENDKLEQYTRKFNIEIHGIPELENDNLMEIVRKVGSKM